MEKRKRVLAVGNRAIVLAALRHLQTALAGDESLIHLADIIDVSSLDVDVIEEVCAGVVEVSDLPSPGDVRELANDSVTEMGDIFFEPQISFEEFQIPKNIAQNRVEDAIYTIMSRLGLEMDNRLAPMPELTDTD